ncbi:hypothetical protein BB561_003992 [Smittium simulii]|uniref:Replication factor C subunit 4 n=1 Tax=Smittium simulii TaxID=133385 RepID=A0A2T9YIH3_9FUNG|nr:hypothetical protein BB561_003992 [Smittium simulii]
MDIDIQEQAAASSSRSVTDQGYNMPWVEKYRPLEISDIVGNEETVKRLQEISQVGNMPNLILTGAPGIGKTTSILCLARSLIGTKTYREAVLELNASDDRGIEVVRNKIKLFAQKKVTLPQGIQKIIILDEADSMTSGAQQALRRIMEIYSNTTRFALACNLSSKIIEPIQSRCAILRYGKLSDEQILKRLIEISKFENVAYTPEGLNAILFTADGDMRQAINNLQSCWLGFGLINQENVFKVCDQPHPAIVKNIIELAEKALVADALKHLSLLWGYGYSAVDIITTFFRVTRDIETISEVKKLDFIREIGLTHMRIIEGVQSLLQLSALVSKMAQMSLPK